jgi:tetratricopeptide (TPR) repeat protein
MKTLDTAHSAFEYDKAVDDYSAALAIKPDNDEALCNRGDVYAHKGEYDKAIADFDQALRLRPGDAEVQEARELALAAKAHEGGGRKGVGGREGGRMNVAKIALGVAVCLLLVYGLLPSSGTGYAPFVSGPFLWFPVCLYCFPSRVWFSTDNQFISEGKVVKCLPKFSYFYLFW